MDPPLPLQSVFHPPTLLWTAAEAATSRPRYDMAPDSGRGGGGASGGVAESASALRRLWSRLSARLLGSWSHRQEEARADELFKGSSRCDFLSARCVNSPPRAVHAAGEGGEERTRKLRGRGGEEGESSDGFCRCVDGSVGVSLGWARQTSEES